MSSRAAAASGPAAAAAAELVEQRGASGRLVIVAIDGPGGSGKSTFARGLAGRLHRATVVPMDDFYRPMDDDVRGALEPPDGADRYFDWQRLRAEVLQPLRAARRARYRPYDWARGDLAVGAIDVRPEGAVLVEGVYTLRRELRGYYDIAVFVDAPPPVRRRRLVERGDPDPWIARWTAAEEWYLANHAPMAHADIVVSGAVAG